MIPGGPRNPRQMEQMMRRLGMSTEPVPGVEEVVVRTRTTEHVFKAPEVTILTVQGVRTYQVVGTPEVRPRSAAGPAAGSTLPLIGTQIEPRAGGRRNTSSSTGQPAKR